MSVFKKGKHWYIDYYVHGQRKRKKIGPSKHLAELALKDVEVKIAKREYLGIYEEKKVRFWDFAKEYLKWCESNKARSTYKREGQMFGKHLIPCFGGHYLPTITRKMIEEYTAKRKQKANVATINREVAALKKLFRKAVEWDYLKQSPAAGIKQFKERPPTPRYLEVEEAAALLEACPQSIYAFVATAVNTGMRKSELFFLEWSDMDFRKRLITVQNKEEFHTKNYESRFIPMNDFLYDVLRKHPRHFSSPYVFCDPNGTRFHDIRSSFGSALKKAGLPHIRIHDLRHTFASHLVMAGVDLPSVQKLMGHKTIQTTMRYAHLTPGHLKAAVEKLSFYSQRDTSVQPRHCLNRA